MKFSNNTSLAGINSIYSYSYNYSINQFVYNLNTLAHYNGEYFDFCYIVNTQPAGTNG